ncbi:hypothetical protein MAR_011154 [Mya arenaria]|uniref:Sushi domain-containing protein n=1 Tax=Mya arenaria TaxID=6604 RepID=A0ABY7FT94_MYAAR|nr:hypothetical protein MAR_011154 [Mya arenaria]
MACIDPPGIVGGFVTTVGPYLDGSTAVYRCYTGYLMSGVSYITCTSSAWSATLPTCFPQDWNDVDVNNDGVPSWLLYMVAILLALLMLLIFACVALWCGQLFGCYERGTGGWMCPPGGGCSGCGCCCRKDRYGPRRVCKTFPRRYEYDESGRRFHLDDLGRRCYYEHKNRTVYSVNGVESSAGSTVGDAVRPQVPAKEVLAWKPHAHPVRNINTSTK